MTFILYGSIALIILAIVFLGIKTIQLLKDSKPAFEKLKTVSDNIQGQLDSINKETNELQRRTTKMSEDANNKKADILFTVNSAKGIGKTVKELKAKVQKKLTINLK